MYILHTTKKADADAVRAALKAQGITAATIKVLCPKRHAEDYTEVYGASDEVVVMIQKPLISAKEVRETLTKLGFKVQVNYECFVRSENHKLDYEMKY